MGESKHTPGEWVAEDRGERIVIMAPDYGREILSVDIPEGEPEEETQRANAAIARAAPQMLEALRGLGRPMGEGSKADGLCFCVGTIPPGAGHQPKCADARAAIKAATGGET